MLGSFQKSKKIYVVLKAVVRRQPQILLFFDKVSDNWGHNGHSQQSRPKKCSRSLKTCLILIHEKIKPVWYSMKQLVY